MSDNPLDDLRPLIGRYVMYLPIDDVKRLLLVVLRLLELADQNGVVTYPPPKERTKHNE
jgi:hypothetical protein